MFEDRPLAPSSKEIDWMAGLRKGPYVERVLPSSGSSLDRASAAKLAAIPAGASPADIGGPIDVVVISSDGKGDRPVGSLDVKASGG